MSDDDVRKVEHELGLTVPAAYRTFVTNYPAALADCGAGDFELMNSADRVIALNRDLRAGGFYGLEWPTHYLAVGENGCGDYYCLDTTASAASVLFFDHERQEFVVAAPSLQEWQPVLLAQYREIDEQASPGDAADREQACR